VTYSKCCCLWCRQNSLNFITFLLFLNIFSGSKLMREFNTKFSLSHIKLFTLVVLHIFIHFSVLNAIVLRARLLWSHLIVLVIILTSKSQIGLFILLLLLYGTVFLLTYVIFHLTLHLSLTLIHPYFPFLRLSKRNSKLIPFTFFSP
jgi:hypothetical protein